VLGVHDFVARDNSVTEDNAHGMQCFSIMAANIPGQFVGSAPGAGFYLFRSEDAGSEYPIEEHNWVCAAERADSAGTDVISSSLGYNTFDNPLFDHTHAQLNGNTTTAAIGADLAAKKGILVVNSAGNEGNNGWGKITTPADGDSVLAVAAVTVNGVSAPFTSRGPSSDGQVKPDVASVGAGTVLQGPANNIGTGNGTSFSCPNMAGLATCLWQGFPEFNNIKIIQALRQAGDRFATPNDTTGYGIPDMRKAVLILLKDFSTAAATASGDCRFNIDWTSKDAAGMKYEVERKSPGETSYTKIGDVPAAGVAFSTQSYRFADSLTNVQAGTISYRIRQIIDTSAIATTGADYIDTITVNLATTCTTTPVGNVPATADEFLLLPNPAFNKVSLRITTSYPIPQLTIRLIDGSGNVVATKQTTKPSGTTTVEVAVSHLPKGTYHLAVFNSKKRLATRELVKL
jgi:serine protease AprX